MVNIILLGPPGAGKGTQAENLVKKFNLVQLSTGDILRAAKSSGSELGQHVAQVMEKGELVTDEIVIGLIHERIENDTSNGFIFDGFPRTLTQADALLGLLNKLNMKLDLVVEMKVDDRVLVERVLNRAQEARAAGQAVRADDNEETMAQRLETYHAQTAPLIEYYKKQGILEKLDAMKSIGEVTGDLLKIVEKSAANASA